MTGGNLGFCVDLGIPTRPGSTLPPFVTIAIPLRGLGLLRRWRAWPGHVEEERTHMHDFEAPDSIAGDSSDQFRVRCDSVLAMGAA